MMRLLTSTIVALALLPNLAYAGDLPRQGKSRSVHAGIPSGGDRGGVSASAEIGFGTENRSDNEESRVTRYAVDKPDPVRPVVVGGGSLNCRVVDTDGAGVGFDFSVYDVYGVLDEARAETAGSPGCVAFFFPQQIFDAPDGRNRGRPSVAALLRRASDEAIALAPAPALAIAPDHKALCGLPTFYWLEDRPRPVSATATAGGITVTAEAYPHSYTWDHGDGTAQTTSTPGIAWSPAHDGTIAHTYETKGTYDVTVEVLWQARWRVNDGPWNLLGYFETTDGRPLAVQEVVAVLTKSRSWMGDVPGD